MQMTAIYTRVSSERQREAHTIASQTAALVEWATTLDLEVPRDWIFEDDGYSGATLERPGLERVRDLAGRAGSPDRLAASVPRACGRGGRRCTDVGGGEGRAIEGCDEFVDVAPRRAWSWPQPSCTGRRLMPSASSTLSRPMRSRRTPRFAGA